MVLINNDFKDALVNKINGILDLDDEHWNNLDKKMKLKYIHRLCNYLEDNKIEKLETLTIPLKSIKPKKLIQYCGISNQYNKNLYLQFNKSILDYTYNFRNKYVKIPKRQHYTYNSLPAKEYNQILNDFNEITYLFMNKNKIDIIEIICLFDPNFPNHDLFGSFVLNENLFADINNFDYEISVLKEFYYKSMRDIYLSHESQLYLLNSREKCESFFYKEYFPNDLWDLLNSFLNSFLIIFTVQ